MLQIYWHLHYLTPSTKIRDLGKCHTRRVSRQVLVPRLATRVLHTIYIVIHAHIWTALVFLSSTFLPTFITSSLSPSPSPSLSPSPSPSHSPSPSPLVLSRSLCPPNVCDFCFFQERVGQATLRYDLILDGERHFSQFGYELATVILMETGEYSSILFYFIEYPF